MEASGWQARGFFFAALLVPFGIGIRRLFEEKISFFVSRQVVLYTTAFLTVGSYLVVVAVAARYLRSVGGTQGELLRVLLFVGAALVLLLVLQSEAIWRRLRVFLTKHFSATNTITASSGCASSTRFPARMPVAPALPPCGP